MNQKEKQSFSFKGDGGTLDSNAPSYVERQADTDLFHYIRSGQFCHIFAPRQMGKSSLTTHIIKRLEKEKETNIHPIFIDLSTYGETDINQWYTSIMKDISRQLERIITDVTLENKSENFAEDGTDLALAPTHRFKTFLEEIVKEITTNKVVIFLDEIDATLELPFADDFFSVIQAIFNARSHNPVFKRLVFVLLGVVTTRQLIQDTNREFNIGQKIDLHEFTWSETKVLRQGMEKFYPGQGDDILFRVMYWTHGHPFLTQKLCQVIAGESIGNQKRTWTDKDIDNLVNGLFLSDGVRSENLSTVDKVVTDQQALLALYRQVREGQKIKDDDTEEVQNRLKLFGLVRTEIGNLEVRNRIYARVFNADWVEERLTKFDMAESRRQRFLKQYGTSITVLMMLFILVLTVWRPINFDSLLANLTLTTPKALVAATTLTEMSTQTVTVTPTATPDLTATIQAMVQAVQTAQPTGTPAPTATDTPTHTPTATDTPTHTPMPTSTSTPTSIPTPTHTPTPDFSEGEFDELNASNGPPGEITFSWVWTGADPATYGNGDEYGFEVQLWKQDQPRESAQGVHNAILSNAQRNNLDGIKSFEGNKYSLTVTNITDTTPIKEHGTGDYFWKVRLGQITFSPKKEFRDLGIESESKFVRIDLEDGQSGKPDSTGLGSRD